LDYIKIHNTFIEYYKNTSPRSRLKENDFRVNDDYLYMENHHIIPKSLGGDNSYDNMVYLLPEEHLFIHKLRYKAFGNREDMLAVRYMINGFNNVSNSKEISNCDRLTKEIRSSVSFIKQNSTSFRLKHGWQTEDGRNRISEYRKGKIPIKSVETGEMLGEADMSHPKVLSGEWVHHSKGMVPVSDNKGNKLYIKSEEYQLNKDIYTVRGSDNRGKGNSRYIDISTEDILKLFEDFCILHGFIMKYSIYKEVTKQINGFTKIPSLTKFRKKELDGKIENIVKENNPDLPLMVKKYYNENDRKLFGDYKSPKLYIFSYYGIEDFIKTINYPSTIIINKNKKEV